MLDSQLPSPRGLSRPSSLTPDVSEVVCPLTPNIQTHTVLNKPIGSMFLGAERVPGRTLLVLSQSNLFGSRTGFTDQKRCPGMSLPLHSLTLQPTTHCTPAPTYLRKLFLSHLDFLLHQLLPPSTLTLQPPFHLLPPPPLLLQGLPP